MTSPTQRQAPDDTTGAADASTTKPFPFPTAEKHDKPAEKPAVETVVEQPSEDAIDHGVEESFPASDPVSVTVSKSVPSKC